MRHLLQFWPASAEERGKREGIWQLMLLPPRIPLWPTTTTRISHTEIHISVRNGNFRYITGVSSLCRREERGCSIIRERRGGGKKDVHHMNSNVPIPCVCVGKAGVFCLSFFDAECDPNSQIPTISAFPPFRPPPSLQQSCVFRKILGFGFSCMLTFFLPGKEGEERR